MDVLKEVLGDWRKIRIRQASASTFYLRNKMNCDYKLVFDFVNNVFLSRSKKNGASKVDMFIIEVVLSFQCINLYIMILEHMEIVVNRKIENMGFLMNFY